MSHVLQIVPRLPPAISGVGDYAVLLADELARAQREHTLFLAADCSTGPRKVGEFPIRRLERRTSARLFAALQNADESKVILLHYVSYGYQKRGCPLWLVEGLVRWRTVTSAGRLVVLFHELVASGPPWSSSFWLSPVQRRIVKRLARTADACVTNMNASAKRLEKIAPRHAGRVVVKPVFSTIGEPPRPKALRDRKPWLVLLGGGAWTETALTTQSELLDQVCDCLGCDRIIAIGAPTSAIWRGRSRFEQTGVLPANEISVLLLQARAGYLHYFKGYLAKSTIFAAYCAHGLLAIFPESGESEADGLYPGEQYLAAVNLTSAIQLDAVQPIVDKARKWYLEHAVSQTASVLAKTFVG